MKFGVTTNSLQIEGAVKCSDWNDWAARGFIEDNTDPYVACEHYKNFESDLKLLTNLNVKNYHMSLDWAKIQPREGEFDQKVTDHYMRELALYKNSGINVTLSLFCGVLPGWFYLSGGFEREDSPQLFETFCTRAAQDFSELVDDFVTMYEPNVYAVNAYLDGRWAPGIKKANRFKKVLANLGAAHILAYKAIKAELLKRKLPVRVGACLQYKIIQPKYRSSFFSSIGGNLANKYFQRALTTAIMFGDFSAPIKLPKGTGLNKSEKGDYCDFVGLSYFTREVIAENKAEVKQDVYVSETGEEIFPEGLKKILKLFAQVQKPIIVLACGVSDSRDSYRNRFICEHVRAAEESGANVEGFYYYSLMDGFEREKGIISKFGLYKVDFGSQKREIRHSGEMYREIINSGKVTPEIFQKYASNQKYSEN